MTLAQMGLSPRSLLLFLVIFLGVSGWLYHWIWGHDALSKAPVPSQLGDVKALRAFEEEVCGPPAPNGHPVAFTMLYSEEKQAWIEAAADDFSRRCPNIQVKLTAMGALQSADAILSGEQRPLVWAPTDDLIVDYLRTRWKAQSQEPLLDASERTSLVVTPLVVLIWYEQLRMMQALIEAQQTREGFWMSAVCPTIPRDPNLSRVLLADQVPARWEEWYAQNAARLPRPGPDEMPLPTQEQVAGWGRVKLAHTQPTRTASGFELLYLLAYDYSVPLAQRSATGATSPLKDIKVQDGAHLRTPFSQNLARDEDALRRWVQRCQAGLGSWPRSTRLLTERMLDVGASDYDGVVTFEHLAFPVLRRIDHYPGPRADVRVIYPQPTLLNAHPAYLLWPNESGPEKAAERRAARRWLTFLRGKEEQQNAMRLGFRPASDLSVMDFDDESNPFQRMQRYGVTPQLSLQEPPRLEGEALPRLVELWKAAAGGN